MKVEALVAGTLLVGGCSEPRPAPAPIAATVPAPTSELATAAALWQTPVTSAAFARRTFYTWTTDDQIAELRAGKVLLSREESPEHGASYYEQVVHALAARDPLAKLLDTTTFAKSRFAWPAPWATREGWTNEHYGDQLVRVTLRPDAIILALSTATGAFEARSLDGAAADPLAHPERIAAVYFAVEPERPFARGIPRNRSAYREYVLCNEAMVQSWTVGTGDIADALAADAAALEALAHFLTTNHAPPELAGQYAAALALDNPNYALAPATLATIARHLRETPKPAPLEGGGHAVFPGMGTARKPPRVVQPTETYAQPSSYIRPSTY